MDTTIEKATEMTIAGETIPGLLLRNARRYGNTKVALRKKDLGIWQPITWQDYYDNVKSFCLGLISTGLKPGDPIFIIGENDPHWIYAELAVQAAGGCAASFYQDAQPQELKYVVDHCDAQFAVAEDQEQVDKILSIKENLPKLKKLIYWDAKGMRHYDDPLLVKFDDIQALGREYEKSHSQLFEELVAKVDPEEVGLMCYTSGTTGFPKSVMLTHRAMIAAADSFRVFASVRETDNMVSFAPLSWSGEQGITLIPSLVKGTVVNFYEEPETVQADIREIGPQFLLGAARMWENMQSSITVKIADSSFLKKLVYKLFMPVGYNVAETIIRRERPNLLWRAMYSLGYVVLFRPLQDQMGVRTARQVVTGGAAAGEDLMRFYRALGVNFLQCYGTTESGGAVCIHRENDVKYETIGHPFPGFEVRVSDGGELMVRSRSLFKGYYKNPQATAKSVEGGWLHTGDAGLIDEDAHIVCIDRMGDLMKLKDGSRFAPSYLELKLKFSPYIRDAIVFGDQQAHVSAVLAIDFDNVGRWAEEHRIAYTTFADLSQKAEVYDLVRQDVERVNKVLPAATQIKKFVNLYKEFDADEAELTRTRKVRRAFVTERYKDLIGAIYGNAPEYAVEAEVKYRDGRVRKMKTSVRIVALDSA